MISRSEIIEILPLCINFIDLYYSPLTTSMEFYSINTPIRMAAFISQVGYESGQFKYVKEVASGKEYERRLDLGNSDSGDGIKYKGRGLIQITGKNNYIQLMMVLGIDCVEHPELLELPENACKSACWFWSYKNLNQLADVDSFDSITKKINGGYNGLQDRYALYLKAKKVLKC